MNKCDQVLANHLQSIVSTNSILANDCSQSLALFDSQVKSAATGSVDIWNLYFYLKVALRSFFAQVDFIGHAMCAAVVEAKPALPNKTMAALSGRQHDEAADAIKKRKRRISTEESLELAFTYFPQICSSSYVFDPASTEWSSFKILVEERNAFTHPDRLEDLMPSRSLDRLYPVTVWFGQALYTLLGACCAHLGLIRPQQLNLPPFPTSTRVVPNPTDFFDEEFYSQVQGDPGARLRYTLAILNRLSDETQWSFGLLQSLPRPIDLVFETGQFRIRNLLRTVFSNAEGMVRAGRFLLAGADGHSEASLERVGEQGSVGVRLADLLTLYSGEVGRNHVVPIAGPKWDGFVFSGVVRNRITHPKNPEELSVSLDEYSLILEGFTWFNDCKEALFLDEERFAAKYTIRV